MYTEYETRTTSRRVYTGRTEDAHEEDDQLRKTLKARFRKRGKAQGRSKERSTCLHTHIQKVAHVSGAKSTSAHAQGRTTGYAQGSISIQRTVQLQKERMHGLTRNKNDKKLKNTARQR